MFFKKIKKFFNFACEEFNFVYWQRSSEWIL